MSKFAHIFCSTVSSYRLVLVCLSHYVSCNNRYSPRNLAFNHFRMIKRWGKNNYCYGNKHDITLCERGVWFRRIQNKLFAELLFCCSIFSPLTKNHFRDKINRKKFIPIQFSWNTIFLVIFSQ